MFQSDLKQKVVKGTFWVLMEKFCCRIVSFGVGIVLARLLTPEDYGTVALTSIFFSIANVLVDGGFGDALIQKKESDDLDFNSVFYLCLALSVVAFGVMFLSAPLIANFYKTPVLVPIVRVSSIVLVFNAINAIQNAELTKKMLFHLSFRISLITCVVSSVCGVTLAAMGYGVWALVWTTLVTGFVGVIARWYIIAWRPRLMFSWTRLKPLFSYGWKMLASSLVNQIFVNLNGFLIGSFYSKADLAYVNKGGSLPRLAMEQIDSTLGRVAFPALVEYQNDHVKLREAMRKMIQCSTFLVFPLMVGMAICSKSVLLLLLGEQWEPATPYMMLACFSFALWPFHTINLRGIMVVGRSDVFLKLEIVKKVAQLVVILLSFKAGVLVFMTVSAFALGPFAVLVNAWPNKKLLGYTIPMQLRDVFPTFSICGVMALVIWGLGVGIRYTGLMSTVENVNIALSLKLTCQFVVGVAVFFGLSWLFRVEPLNDCIRIAKPILGRFGLRRSCH